MQVLIFVLKKVLDILGELIPDANSKKRTERDRLRECILVLVYELYGSGPCRNSL